MADKTLEMVQVKANDGATAVVPVGVATSDRPGPTLVVITGIHGTEYVAHETVLEFWHSLDPSTFSGEVRVVLIADVAAALANRPATNPVDGKNLNRVWPGDANGTISEAIAACLMTRVMEGADAVVDVHGGEWNEIIDMYVITHRGAGDELDARAEAFASALGYPLVEVTDMDGSFLGKGMCSSEALRDGRLGVTIEIGGQGRYDERWAKGIRSGLSNAMSHLGMTSEPVTFVDGTPRTIRQGLILRSTHDGWLQHSVWPPQVVTAGATIATVRDLTGALVQEIVAPEDVVIMCLPAGRGVVAGGFAAKVGAL